MLQKRKRVEWPKDSEINTLRFILRLDSLALKWTGQDDGRQLNQCQRTTLAGSGV